MKSAFLALALALCLGVRTFGDEPSHIKFGGGDGSSQEKAIIITGAKDDYESTHSEYVYVADHFPKSQRPNKQWLLHGDKRYFDKLEFVAADGSTHFIFFDITESFEALAKEFDKKPSK